DNWRRSREALGEFLSKNPGGLVKRIEYVGSNKYLEEAKQSDQRLAGSRKIDQVYNAKVKFKRSNPLLLHVIIGQREAIIALPKNSGQSSGSDMAILVRDKIFVDSLRVWYDEVLWDGGEPSQVIDFTNFDESFQEVKKMYGYSD
ncbi:MAG: hypothetical protein ABIS59_00890, partial [Candidatus Saccharibacteria bacterium]